VNGFEQTHAGVAVVSPSREDPVVRVASAVVGGPAGRRLAAGRGFWHAVPVLVLLAVAVLGLGVVQKQHCRADGWSSPDQFWHACYSDIPALYGSAALGTAQRPGLGEAVSSGVLQQPPLPAAAMWAVSGVVGDGTSATAPRRFFDLSTVLLGAALAVAVACTALAAGRRRWDAAHLALAPVLVTAGLISYDLLAVALLAAALLAWSRGRTLPAGVLLGLAVAARPLASLVVLALVVVCVRAGRGRAALPAVAAAALTWFGLRLLLFPGFGAGVSQAWDAWRRTGPGYGSTWLVPQLLSQSRPPRARWWYEGGGLATSTTTVLSIAGLAVVVVVVLLVGFGARRRPRVAPLALVAVCGALLVATSVPVQAGLLLLPLIALAGLRWRDHLIWAATEAAYFVGVWMYIAASSEPNKGLPAGGYLVFLLLRLAGIAWIGAQGLRICLDASRDPVRTPADGGPGEDDPLAGAARDRDDALVVQVA